MQHYYKQCENAKQVNAYIHSLAGKGYECLNDWDWEEWMPEEDFDGWINAEETLGLSLQITKTCEVYATKYTRRDIENAERRS